MILIYNVRSQINMLEHNITIIVFHSNKQCHLCKIIVETTVSREAEASKLKLCEKRQHVDCTHAKNKKTITPKFAFCV